MRRAVCATAIAIGCGRVGFGTFTEPDAHGPPNVRLVQALAPGYGSAATVTYSIAQLQGDLLIAGVYWHESPDTVTLTDQLGLVWTSLPIAEVSTGCTNSDGNSTDVQIWYAQITTSGANQIQLAQTSGVNPLGAFLVEYSGVEPIVDAQVTGVAPAAGSAMQIPQLTTTTTDLLVAVFNDTLGSGSMTPGSGWTAEGRDLGFYTLVEDRVEAPGTYTPDGTLPSGKSDACWAGAAAAFAAR